MRITQVIIEGFKSFKDRTVIGPFDEGLNVVVGRNGSGKSNFFAAIEFVLSDEFTNLSPDQRSSLLHEGTGGRILSAFVEILFDNQDHRFPLNTEEVSIRRSIGNKKDQYCLNGKLASGRLEVRGLLEAAGFSYSNPYYVVKQGKIQILATCSEKERLKLVKCVAGTDVYTEKKKVAEAELVKTEESIVHIEESLKLANERLDQLGEEKEKLQEFRKNDLRKRTIEYVFLEKEISTCHAKLKDVNKELEGNSASDDDRKQIESLKSDIENEKLRLESLLSQLSALNSNVAERREQVEKLERRKDEVIRQQSDLDHETPLDELQGNLETCQSELLTLDNEKSKVEGKLDRFLEQENELKERLLMMEQQNNNLLQKKSRQGQFDSKEERDDWLKTKKQAITAELQLKEMTNLELNKEIQEEKLRTSELEKQLNSFMKEMTTFKEDADASSTKLNENLKKRDVLSKQMMEDFEKLRSAKAAEQELKLDEMNFKNKLKSISGLKPILIGLESLMVVVQDIEGYHGMLIELFNFEPELTIAVDVAAGNKLFSHVVDTDETATKILSEMNRLKMKGTCNFLPLNRIVGQDFDLSKVQRNDTFPILEKLKFSPKYLNLMKFVFGKTLLCRTMDVVVDVVRQHKLNGITLDGEKGSSSGVLSGGYLAKNKLKVTVFNELAEIREKLLEVQSNNEQIEENLANIQASLRKIETDIEHDRCQKKICANKIDELSAETKIGDVEKSAHEERVNLRIKCYQEAEISLKLMRTSLRDIEEELQEELNSQMTAEESRSFVKLVRRMEEVRRKLKEKQDSGVALHKENTQMRIQCSNAKKECQRLEDEITRIKGIQRKSSTAKLMMTSVAEEMKREADLLERLEQEEMSMEDELQKCRCDFERMEKGLEELKSKLADENSKVYKILEKKQNIQSNLNGLNVKMKAIQGGVDDRLAAQVSDVGRNDLLDALKKINNKLKKFDGVNKKALALFDKFTEEEAKLSERCVEVMADKEKILQLLSALELQKDEQVLYTFKQVQKHFESTFSSLVPGGKGRVALHLQDEGSQNSEEVMEAEKMNQAVGLLIEVNFSGNGDGPLKSLQQLSGGQKTLVAIALIIAIQKCDPAPFYLFDEVDAALDPSHRTAVANIVKSQTEGAQFILTTFRPELVVQADKQFGVLFRGKASHVEEIDRRQAEDFVEGNENTGIA